jgi:peptidoglycan/LPS O-acetylase OafA/YrhL
VKSPYLEPVATVWGRIAGIVLLACGAGLTAVLGHALFDLAADEASRRSVTSSTLIFTSIQLALCGICWQAGYRLAFNRPDRSGTLFSRPAWFAIGSGLVVVAALMAFAIFSVRRPTGLDYWVVVTLGALGIWCIILACRRGQGRNERH